MRLVSAESVLDALGIGQQAGSLKVAEAALDAITPRFEQYLERKFSEASVTDYFDVLPGRGIKRGSVLRLAYGDVSKVVVRYSADGKAPADKATGVIAPTTEYVVDAVGGNLTLIGLPQYGYRALSVTYAVGYEVDPAKQLPVIPDWLAEAAKTAAIAVLQGNPTTIAKDKTRFVGEFALPELRGVFRSMLSGRLRPRAGMVFPVVSEVVDA